MPAPISIWRKARRRLPMRSLRARLRLRGAKSVFRRHTFSPGAATLAPSRLHGGSATGARSWRELFDRRRDTKRRITRWADQVAAAIGPLERGAKEFEVVLRWIIPLSLAAVPVVANAAATAPASAPASAAASLPLPSSASWWEKVTVKMTGNGEAQNCQYTTSRAGAAAPDCKVVGAGLSPQAASSAAPSTSAKDAVTTITFERRFSPGSASPSNAELAAGEKLLGKEVIALAIDHAGKVSGCRVVDSSGETGLAYGCDEATAETFEASGAAASGHRLGFMTILVYGHNEHVV